MESSRIGRYALVAAALIAGAAIGAAVYRGAKPAETVQADPAQSSPDQAIAQLEAGLAANPEDVEGWRRLGWSFFQTGRYAESATAYRRATALRPADAELWSSLGEALVMASERPEMPADASQAFGKAIALDAKEPRARYFLAVEKDLAGDHRQALDDWFALLADTPAGAPWEANLRRTIEQVAAREKIDVAGRLAAIEPAPPAPSPATAAIPGPSAEQMRAAAALPPGQQQAMVQGMVESLEAKLQANPANPDGWMMLMRSRMTLGETAKAATAWKSAVAANPEARSRLDQAARALGVPGA